VWRTSIVIPRICEREMQWFMQLAQVREGINDRVRITWTSPHRDLLDPKQEIAALKDEMRLGALSYPDMVRMRGRNPDMVIAEWEKWAKDMDSRELAFDWDPRRFSSAGNDIQQSVEAERPSVAPTDKPKIRPPKKEPPHDSKPIDAP